MIDDRITNAIVIFGSLAYLIFRIWLTMEDGWIPLFPQSKIQTLFGPAEKH